MRSLLRSGSMASALLAATACVDVAFDDGGGGSTSASSGTGTSSAGGGPGATTTVSTGTAGGGQGGAGGAGPCVPTTEVCNDVDDDCDGLVDQPPGSIEGSFCGCDWTFDASNGGRAYALCPTTLSFAQAACPGGTEKVVLQTAAEVSFLQSWVNPLLVIGDHAYIGLTQAPMSPSTRVGWTWTGGSGSPGMVPPWNLVQPDDFDGLEPAVLETGDQDCGSVWKSSPAMVTLDDVPCSGSASHVLCETLSPQACVAGTGCLLAEGCAGTMDCALPTGSQCTAAPVGESCDGKDNDCDGAVDLHVASGDHACDCTTSTNAGRSYKYCTANRTVRDAQCGPGYRLAIIGSSAENDYVQTLAGPNDAFIGLYQLTSATAFAAEWFWMDGTALGTSYWDPISPNDAGGTEDGEQNCGIMMSAGWKDRPCDAQYDYICEQL